MTPKEFLDIFPSSNLNIKNPLIIEKINNFILEYPDLTSKRKFTPTFINNYFSLEGKTTMQTIYWETRGWDDPINKVKEMRAKSLTPNQIKYWISRGHSKVEAKEKASEWIATNISSTSPKFYEARGYSPEEAKEKAKHFYEDKIKGKRLLPTQLEYYIQKGQSEEEAKQSLREEQLKRTAKLVAKEKANPELRKRRLWNQIEYWLERGYSEEVGYQLMQEKFKERNLQTMKKLTKKFINDGFIEEEAIQLAKESYKKRAAKIKQIKMDNKSFGWQKASKQSLKFFKPLMDYLDENKIEYYVGDENHNEWFIAKGADYFYSYDFCIPSMKIIIEYNGEHIHPNPNMSKANWQKWKHCWTKESADVCRAKDQYKIDIAKEKGFNVIEVFESEEIDIMSIIFS